jgi:hypothetical protein
MLEHAGLLMDDHVLENVERARNVFQRYAVGRQYLAEIFRAAVGGHFWHRAGFRRYWGWKSRKRVGRPKIDRGLRELIQRMSRENPKWGASRILTTTGFARICRLAKTRRSVGPCSAPGQLLRRCFRTAARRGPAARLAQGNVRADIIVIGRIR